MVASESPSPQRAAITAPSSQPGGAVSLRKLKSRTPPKVTAQYCSQPISGPLPGYGPPGARRKIRRRRGALGPSGARSTKLP
jgi:hypothetical protein